MSKFSINEESENVKSKLPKMIKNFPDQLTKNRVPLQSLYGHAQKIKQEEKKPVPDCDVLKLKAVFKKRTVLRVHSSDCKEYEEEIWQYLRRFEQQNLPVSASYMGKQIHLSWEMRRILVDWLVSVGNEYQLNENTLHLSVNYLDRFLSNISVIKEKFQLVGATAMMIAGKVEDIYPPDTKEWSYLTGDAFTVPQLLKMEQFMLKVLDFNMNPPTTLDFLKHLCVKHAIDQKTMYLAMYLSELVLLEGKNYLKYFPSKIAASSLVLARHTLSKPQIWSKKMEETSGYTLKQLSPVVQKQQKTFKNSPFREQQAIQKKYATDKYQKVALLKPRVLVLDEEE